MGPTEPVALMESEVLKEWMDSPEPWKPSVHLEPTKPPGC